MERLTILLGIIFSYKAVIRSRQFWKFYFVCEPWTESTAAKCRRFGHICLFFRKMAANGANDTAVRVACPADSLRGSSRVPPTRTRGGGTRDEPLRESSGEATVHRFLHQLLHSIVRQIENNDGRGDNADGVLYRVDWLYNCLVRYVGSYNIDENIVRLVGRSRDMLEDMNKTRGYC